MILRTSPNFVMCVDDRKRENPEIDPATNRIIELQPDGDSVKDYEFDAAGNTIKDPDNRRFKYDGENFALTNYQLSITQCEIKTPEFFADFACFAGKRDTGQGDNFALTNYQLSIIRCVIKTAQFFADFACFAGKNTDADSETKSVGKNMHP